MKQISQMKTARSIKVRIQISNKIYMKEKITNANHTKQLFSFLNTRTTAEEHIEFSGQLRKKRKKTILPISSNPKPNADEKTQNRLIFI